MNPAPLLPPRPTQIDPIPPTLYPIPQCTQTPGPIERGGVVVQSWQRVPSTLLQEHCQREKRPRPSYRCVCVCMCVCLRVGVCVSCVWGVDGWLVWWWVMVCVCARELMGGPCVSLYRLCPFNQTLSLSLLYTHDTRAHREVSLRPGEKGVKTQVVLPDPKGAYFCI
jgi:hypothetical protein